MASLSQPNQLQLGNRWAYVTGWLANPRHMVGFVLLCVHASAMNGQAQSMRVDPSRQVPPGAIGHRQLPHSESLREYFLQPVQITAPGGALIAPYDGSNSAGEYAFLNVGLLVGNVYRFRVSEITNLQSHDLFPSVEVIDRLYPPVGREQEFPIPIELSPADLQLAAAGKYVVRVIYVEDPDDPFPYGEADPTQDQSDVQEQRYFEVPPGEDPYSVAAGLGRPVAILRIGNRAPTIDGDNFEFSFGSQPMQHFSHSTAIPSSTSQLPDGAIIGRKGHGASSLTPFHARHDKLPPRRRKSFMSRVSALLPLKD